MKVALVTDDDHSQLIASDHLLADELRARGIETTAAIWNGPFDVFRQSDLVVIRTPWDYVDHRQDFTAWLERLERESVNIHNPVSLIRWNMNKRYLLELADNGAPIPATRICGNSLNEVISAVGQMSLDTFVLKPAVGASGVGLSLCNVSDRAGVIAAIDAIDGDMVVQALVPEIKTHGETSFVFFAGRYSHSALKRPKGNEIRCQSEHGGSVEATSPPRWATAAAAAILDLLPERALYARIDAVIAEDHFHLMEVEVIEPELFFDMAPGSASAFAELLCQSAAIRGAYSEVAK